ncbi:efflux RND transporter permease subunit, partial [Escherichia coli]|nr:efflux RND transporter permease subunit [Escherichia coli]
LVYALVIGVVALLFVRLPQAFLPEEDQGDFMIMVMQPEGTPMAETMANVGDVERYLAEHEPVAYAYAVGGFSLYGDGTSSAMIFATLKDWSERREASQHVGAIVERIT